MDYKEAKELISANRKLNFDESFQLTQLISKMISAKNASNEGRDLIIRVLDIWDKIPSETEQLWKDIIESAGFYPYLGKEDLSGAGLLRREYHRSKYLPEETYLHAEQMSLSIMLEASNSLIVSAPTSFGKSKLIEEVVASLKYKNIVIIQPTLALLDETRKKLRKYSSEYNMVVTTTQRPTSGKNLFLFTGERVAEYEYFPKIDFFVIDEFYKLSIERDDERTASLNHALYKLLSMTHKFYMLGPSINSIPPGFAEQHNAAWFKTDFATVAVDIERIWDRGGRAKEEEKELPLFNLLKQLKEPTIIYCSSPNKTNKLTRNFLKFVMLSAEFKSELNNNNNNIVEWIKENIHEDWILAKALKYSIGMHHGALPRHLSSSIIDLFNLGKVRYLFCTSTLIEGVNTSAKNVVLFDKKKGSKPIDYFDFKNIAGRSGRMKTHFIGRVFQFHKEPKQEELDIDIPLFTQKNAPLELLIQIDPKEIKDVAAKKLDKFSQLDSGAQSLIKKNKGVSVEGQMKVLDIFRRNIDSLYDKISWSGVPHYPELAFVIGLGWENFRTVSSSSEGGARSPKHLATLTLQYLSTKSIKGMIEMMAKNDYWVKQKPNAQERVEAIVDIVLQVNQHWFRYKLPKWLSVLSEIQKYVCQEKGRQSGDYGVLANLIENSFLPSHLAVLLEYGLPPSAIRKIGEHIKQEMEPEELITTIKSLDVNKLGLLPYEVEKIKDL